MTLPAAPEDYAWHDVDVQGSRRIEVLTTGPADGLPFVFHSGTPSGAAPFDLLTGPASSRGLRTIMYSRPGYGTSTTAKGRTVADAAADTAAVLASLGYGDDTPFVTAGWSGGGPHALACVALLADRCLGAGVIAGVAPADTDGLSWTAGMAQENIEEFEAARAGGDAFGELLGIAAEMMATVTEPAMVAEALGGLITDPDRNALLHSGIADYMIPAFRQAVLHGTDGWRDDDLAFLAPWGFDPGIIERPVCDLAGLRRSNGAAGSRAVVGRTHRIGPSGLTRGRRAPVDRHRRRNAAVGQSHRTGGLNQAASDTAGTPACPSARISYADVARSTRHSPCRPGSRSICRSMRRAAARPASSPRR